MLETIYTIPVNEAFDSCAQSGQMRCPFCELYSKLEENELDIILGASMMEPDVRIKTNERGFCPTHFDMMLERSNRLGTALILQSHLDRLFHETEGFSLTDLIGKPKAEKRLSELEKSCYICERIEYSFSRMISNAVLLWENDGNFEMKIRSQKMFCLPHYRRFLKAGYDELKRGRFSDFKKVCDSAVFPYFKALRGDIDLFCKKFDYRYEDEPWGNSRDSIERAVKFLSSDIHRKKGEK